MCHKFGVKNVYLKAKYKAALKFKWPRLKYKQCDTRIQDH